MNQVKQIQETKSKKMSTFAKAQVIEASKRIHKSSVSDIWLIESESVKDKFYKVVYVDGELMCDCKAFEYGMTNPCKHILSLAIKEVV